MVLYFSDNKETEHKKKDVFYEETLPENAVIFGSTTLKKYSGGSADYMKIGTKRYYIDEPVNERDVIGYIPVVAERYPSASSDTTDPTTDKYGYIQLKEGFPFLLYLLPILLLFILLALFVHSVGGNGSFKKDVVLPDNKHDLPAVMFENKETTEEPEKNQDPVQTPAPTKEPEKDEKNEPVAALPMDPVIDENLSYWHALNTEKAGKSLCFPACFLLDCPIDIVGKSMALFYSLNSIFLYSLIISLHSSFSLL